VENVAGSVVPVRVAGHVRAHLHNWLARLFNMAVLRVTRHALLSAVSHTIGSFKIHFVGVDDLGLLLQVERLLVILNFSLL